TQDQIRATATGRSNGSDISKDPRFHGDVAHFIMHGRQSRGVDHRLDAGFIKATGIESAVIAAQDLLLHALQRIVDNNLDEKAVQLRLRQWIRALVLHGILGGEYHEGLAELMADTVYGDLALFHRLK